MLFHFGLKSSLLFVFFLHGIVFTILLLVKAVQHEVRSCFWLGVFVLLCTLYISPFMLGYAGWYSQQPYRDILFYVPFQQLLLLPPVLFFYARSVLDKSFLFSKKNALHFLPAAVYFLYSVVVLITDKVVLNDNYFYQDGRDKDFSPWYQVAGFISLLFYLVSSLTLYFRYRKMTYELTSFADSVMFRWIKRFLLAFLVLLVLRGLFFIINPEWAEFGRKFWYYLSFSVLFYYISISGYINSVQTGISLNSAIPLNPASEKSGQYQRPAVSPDSIQANETIEDNSLLPDLESWKTKIEALMLVDKLFQNSTLTLSDVAAQLNAPPKKVSQAINLGFNMNFNDFVNYYRTSEVISKFQSGEHNLQTLLGIAYDCGFNSKSTFNRAFKKQTSYTPKEYLEKYAHK